MPQVLDRAGTLAGVIGLIICVVSGLMRLAGNFYLGEIPVVTVFIAGGGLMVAACYLKLEALSLRG